MKLSKVALQKIRSDQRIKTLLALALGRSAQSVYYYIKRNDDELTKAAALAVIKKETGLSENEILETGEEVAA
jgi:protein involved in sex pheromone biosynthesis